jgi:PAS domain S-box-containing protein
MVKDESCRIEQLLIALGQAGVAMNQVLTPETIFSSVVQALKQLGFSCMIWLADQSRGELSPTSLSYGVSTIRAAEKLTGIRQKDFSVSTEAVDLFKQVVKERQTVFVPDSTEVVRQILPKRLRGHAQTIVNIFKVPKAINAPLLIEDQVIGLLSVQSNDLAEKDMPAITSFANQLSAAWHNAQLYEKAQQEIAKYKHTEEAPRFTQSALETDDQPVRMSGLTADITERKQGENALENVAREWRTTFDAVSDSIWLLDTDQNIKRGNKATEKLLSHPLQSILGHSCWEIVHGTNEPPPQCPFLRMKQSLQQEKEEYQLDDRWLEISVDPILGKADDLLGAVHIIRDITKRKQVELERQVMLEIMQGVASTKDLQDSLRLIHRLIGKVIYAKNFFVTFYNKISEKFEEVYSVDKYDAPAPPYKSKKSKSEFIVLNGESLLVKNEHFEELVGPGKVDLVGTPSAAWLGVPIKTSDEVIGVLGVQNYEDPNCYSERDKEFLTFVGSQVALALQRKWAEENIHRRMMDLEVLYESSLSLQGRLSPQEIGRMVIQILQHRLEWHHAVVLLKREGSDELEIIGFATPAVSQEEYAEEIDRLNRLLGRPDLGITGWVAQHGQTVRSGDLSSDSRYIETYAGIRSGLYVPMKAGEETIGVISVESGTEHAFDENNERLLETLSKITASAIHRTLLRQQTEEQLQRLAALRAIDQAISGSLDLHITLDIFLKNAVAQLNADAALILVFHPMMNTLEYAGGHGFYTNVASQIRLRLGEGYAGRVVLDRRMMSITNLSKEDRSFIHPTLVTSEGFASYQAVPLIAKGQVKGVLEVFHSTPFEPSAEWLDFLNTLAGQAAIAVDNSQLFESLQRSNLDLEVAYDATIEGWSKALDLRDRETEGHTQRVAEITQRLGQIMGLQETDLVHIRRGALLHDIGKMGVPDSILFKPGKLDAEEWEIMKQHPQLAYDMLAPITYLGPAMDIPYCHHEKWDGSGYPQKLKGRQIPLAARIFAVVDVYDALTSDRPYRKSWTKEKTLEYISEQTGEHFDPDVVKLFLEDAVNI